MWRDIPVYVVGQATSNAVKSLLGLGSLGKESGSAEVLARFIIKNTKTPGKLLFPRGNLAKVRNTNLLFIILIVVGVCFRIY